MTEPYVGQTVHFVDGGTYAGWHLAATIVYIVPGTDGNVVNLNVHNPGTGWPVDEPIFAQPGIPRDEGARRIGSWHYIEIDIPWEPPASTSSISSVSQTVNIGVP